MMKIMHFEKLLCNQPNPDVTQWTHVDAGVSTRTTRRSLGDI